MTRAEEYAEFDRNSRAEWRAGITDEEYAEYEAARKQAKHSGNPRPWIAVMDKIAARKQIK